MHHDPAGDRRTRIDDPNLPREILLSCDHRAGRRRHVPHVQVRSRLLHRNADIGRAVSPAAVSDGVSKKIRSVEIWSGNVPHCARRRDRNAAVSWLCHAHHGQQVAVRIEIISDDVNRDGRVLLHRHRIVGRNRRMVNEGKWESARRRRSGAERVMQVVPVGSRGANVRHRSEHLPADAELIIRQGTVTDIDCQDLVDENLQTGVRLFDDPIDVAG